MLLLSALESLGKDLPEDTSVFQLLDSLQFFHLPLQPPNLLLCSGL